ncbi:MAG: TVP38/TMEM64 family protein [Flavobacterium sp.]|nr:TVP38/TMEM64 family protein [Flavobacterium sp.]
MEETHQVSVKKSRKPLYISLTILIGLVLGYFLIPDMRNWLDEAWSVLTSGNEQRIQDWVANFGWFGPVLIVIAMVAQMFLVVIPSWLLMLVSVLAYGPYWGSLIVLIAIFTASSVGYFIGRYFGPAIVDKLLGKKTEDKIADFLDQYGIWAIIITRLNPLLSNDAISLMAGILRMGYWKFIGATMAGITPLIIYIAVLGQLTSGFKTGLLWGSVVSLVLFVGYVWWDKKRRKQQNKS